LRQFPESKADIPSWDSLKDGVALTSIWSFFSGQDAPADASQSASSSMAWFPAFKRLRTLVGLLKGTRDDLTVDAGAIARRGDEAQLESLILILIQYSLQSPKQSEADARLKSLPEADQNALKSFLQTSTKSPEAKPASEPESPEARAKLLSTKQEIDRLRAANADLQAEITALKQKATEPVPDASYARLAEAKVQCFTLDVSNNTKSSRLQALIDIEAHIGTLRTKIDELTPKCRDLEQQLQARDATKLDLSFLTDKLREIKADPALAEVERLLEERRGLKRDLTGVQNILKKMQARLDGQQGMAILAERKVFLQQLHEANIKRKQRMELHLMLMQKKMRQEAFQLEMRAFV
jgi:hypothetical protein